MANEFSRVHNHIAQINERLDGHDEQFVKIDDRFDRLDQRLDSMADDLLRELKSFITILREEQRDQHRAFLDELRTRATITYPFRVERLLLPGP